MTMGNATGLLTLAIAATLALAIAAAAALRGWQGWLELRRLHAQRRGRRPESARHAELASLKERVRRLEAIANGSEL